MNDDDCALQNFERCYGKARPALDLDTISIFSA